MYDVEKMRFWCQKIIPLVYDDSLSYYETLCKVVKKLNEVIESVDNIPEYIAELISTEHLQDIMKTLLVNLEKQIASANEGLSETATADRPVGTLVWLNGYLYRAIEYIDAGDRYVVDGNVEKITIEECIKDLILAISNNYEENDRVASTDREAGELVWFKNQLLYIKQDIEEGNAYTSANSEVVDLSTLFIRVHNDIVSEATARENADTALGARIDGEISNRENADTALGARIDDEITDRENADTALGARIDDEITDRENADTALGARIDEEITAREDADTLINNRIDSLLYNVKDYGAVGDGVTDDTTAILSAVDVVNQTGGIIYFPQGRYIINDTLTFTHVGTCVKGATSQGTYILQDSDKKAIVFGTGDSGLIDLRVENIGIIYHGASAPSPTTYGVYFNYCVNSSMDDVIVEDFYIGVKLSQTGNSLVNNVGVVSSHANSIGFQAGEKSVSSSMTNCYVGFSGNAVDNGAGFITATGDIADFTLKYFDVGNGAYGVYIDGADSPADYPPTDIRLYDVVADGSRVDCIYIANINANGSVLIHGGWLNPLQNGNRDCLRLMNTNNVIVDNVTLQSITNVDAQTFGVTGGDNNNLQIVNNNFVNISGPISLQTTSGIVSSNTITHVNESVVNAGINLTDCDNVIVTDNNVTGNYTVASIMVTGTTGHSIIKNNIVKTAISDTHSVQIVSDNIVNGVVTP